MRSDRVKLVQDGKRASELLANGMKPRDVLLVVGGSRARLYRALTLVENEKHVTESEETQKTVSLCE